MPRLLQCRIVVSSLASECACVPDHAAVSGPPWTLCAQPQAAGNTFLNCRPEFSPKASLSAASVSFPPCRPGESSHQTLAISNPGDTPVAYSFSAASLGPCFQLTPMQGVVPPKSQALVRGLAGRGVLSISCGSCVCG